MTSKTKLPLRKISVARYRAEVGKLDRLVESITKEGLHRPLVLSPNGTLLSGERRFAALEKMARSEAEVVYVSDIGEFAKLLREDLADKTGYLSMRPSEVAAQLDLALNSGLSVPTSPFGRPVSVSRILGEAIGVPELMVTSILLIYRTANFGLDAEDRAWGFEELTAIDDGHGITPARRRLTEKLEKKYPEISRLDYRYIEVASKGGNGITHPNAITSASEQRHTLERATELLTSTASGLRLLGPLDKKISTEERLRYASAMRVARTTLSSIITTLEGNK